MQSLKEVLEKAGVPLTTEEEQAEQEQMEQKHRSKTVRERPQTEVALYSLYEEDFVPKKVAKDPTPELVEMPVGMSPAECRDWLSEQLKNNTVDERGYVVICENTLQAWYCKNKLVLDMNFIYRKDLLIEQITSNDLPISALYENTASDYNPGVITRKTCYILDSPANETYEVFYESNYASLKYGKATPNGMFVHKYENRFHRDMAILELDDLYSNQSSKKAGVLTKRELASNEAIIISDGCWMKNSCSSAFYYLDATSLVKMTEGFLPSEADQAVLISEIVGASNALRLCVARHKKKITYYYDNTSILNVFRNRKTEYIQEIVEYKQLLEEMAQQGYNVTFVELHPKTGEDRANENRALMFFHNGCDKECQEMADIFKKDYKDIAALNNPSGKTFQQVKQEFKPKGKPGTGNGNKPGNMGANNFKNNAHNGNNKYGRRI